MFTFEIAWYIELVLWPVYVLIVKFFKALYQISIAGFLVIFFFINFFFISYFFSMSSVSWVFEEYLYLGNRQQSYCLRCCFSSDSKLQQQYLVYYFFCKCYFFIIFLSICTKYFKLYVFPYIFVALFSWQRTCSIAYYRDDINFFTVVFVLLIFFKTAPWAAVVFMFFFMFFFKTLYFEFFQRFFRNSYVLCKRVFLLAWHNAYIVCVHILYFCFFAVGSYFFFCFVPFLFFIFFLLFFFIILFCFCACVCCFLYSCVYFFYILQFYIIFFFSVSTFFTTCLLFFIRLVKFFLWNCYRFKCFITGLIGFFFKCFFFVWFLIENYLLDLVDLGLFMLMYLYGMLVDFLDLPGYFTGCWTTLNELWPDLRDYFITWLEWFLTRYNLLLSACKIILIIYGEFFRLCADFIISLYHAFLTIRSFCFEVDYILLYIILGSWLCYFIVLFYFFLRIMYTYKLFVFILLCLVYVLNVFVVFYALCNCNCCF